MAYVIVSDSLRFFFSLLLIVVIPPVDANDPIDGFTEVPLNVSSNFELHKAYDMPACSRYLYSNGTHRFWALKDDMPAWENPGNGSHPRSEIRMRGYEYATGVWQFEGYGYVPNGTTGVCIMQVFGADTHPTTMMLKVFDCSLCFYNTDSENVLAIDMCDKWFRLNVIHDTDAASLSVFIDGELVKHVGNRTYAQHWFQFGVYAQLNYSYYMESRWKDVKVLKIIDA